MKKVLFSIGVILLGNLCFSQWSQVNNGIQDLSYGVLTISGHNGKMYTGTLGGYKLYKSDDYGNNWSEIAPPVAFGLPVSTFSYGNRLFFGLNVVSNDVYYTEDDGATWQVALGGPQSSVVDGFYAFSDKLFCYTTNSGVYRSSDGGTNWTQINNGLTILNVAKLESIGNRLLACTINGGVYVSDDYGDTWTQSNTGISSGHLAGYQLFRLGSDLYYMDQSAGRYKSTDQGNSWNSITQPSFWGIKPRIVYRNAQSGNIYMKNAFGVFGEIDSLFVSSNEGVNWTNITENLPQAFNEAEFTEYNGYVFYAFDISVPGEGVYRKGDFNSLSEKEEYDIEIYPNPASDKINLNSDQPLQSVAIIDISGRTVLVRSLNFNKSCSLELPELPKGYYVLKLTTSNGNQVSRKVIIE
ncbi:MAG: T9SS type A sorting domain-containing protein [Cryomorphaceae bacterium]|jgi:photosystem II stability/assembly factor-like uncharacterized protein|nr:T9SS type A sorting domain-containing protein [Cryomorphaceae bacterium]